MDHLFDNAVCARSSVFLRSLIGVVGFLLIVACSKNVAQQKQNVAETCLGPSLVGAEVLVEAGTFSMGDIQHYPEERPLTEKSVNDFWVDRTEVTNAQFASFVEATGYLTQAEKGFDRETFPEIAAEFRVPGSMVFTPPEVMAGASPLTWWKFTPGANWRHPYGADSSIEGKDQYPVVHVTYRDAAAYADWAGRRLLTEVEWEFAAQGADKNAASSKEANTWQGLFPVINAEEDGFEGMAPVGCFPENKAGLYDMIGNVWELSASAYFPSHDEARRVDMPDTGFDLRQPGIPVHVIKGGSYLCAENYCVRYRPSARQAQDAYLGTSHIGFRTARDG